MAFGYQSGVVLIAVVVLAYWAWPEPQSILTETLDDTYDYIVVGGGSAGSIVAARLSEEKQSKVLLLEAGGHYNENWKLFFAPSRFPEVAKTEYDWEYYTEPQEYSNKGLVDQKGYWPRGRVLGGSHNINGMQYTRGSRFEYDEWTRNGCDGWSYKDVLPYFLKTEDILIEELKSSRYHSTGGPMAVSDGRATPIADLFLKAGAELGYDINDYNGADQEGFQPVQLTIRDGLRSSTAGELLGRTADRDNLHIAVRSLVTKVEIRDNRATGVYVVRNGRKYFIKANREVIVSAGAINSPQLLMLSGIGPKEHLESLRIPVIADLPVGQNLQDHQMVYMFSRINKPYSTTGQLKYSLWTKLKYSLFNTGPLAVSGLEGSGFAYVDTSRREKTYPEIQFILITTFLDVNANNFNDQVFNEYFAKPNMNEEGFNFIISVTHPKSKGTLTLRSGDPFDYPILDPQYLTDKQDVDEFIAGIRIWEQFVQTPTMKELGVDIEQAKISMCAEHEFRSDAYWECFVRHLAVTVYHQSGTCKMGAENDVTAVVDPMLRVKGIKGLRVVDASVFPNITTGNTNAPVIMVAEKAADMIRGIDSVGAFRENLHV